MASVSKQLLIDVQQILNILGIYSYVQKPKKRETNNRGTLLENIHQMYTLNIKGSQINKLTEMLNIKLEYKQKHLMDTLEHTYKYEIHKNDTIIPNEIDCVNCIISAVSRGTPKQRAKTQGRACQQLLRPSLVL